MGQPRHPSPATPPPGLPLRYTDHAVRDVPWWRSHVTRVVWSDLNPMPYLRLWRWWPTRRQHRDR